MTQKIIDLGQLPSGIGGDTSRSANVKCNENFTELYKNQHGLKVAVDGKAGRGNNTDIASLSGLTTALSIKQGGTGAKNPADACRNIGALGSGIANNSFGTVLQNGDMPSMAWIEASNKQYRGPLTIHNDGNDHASCVITFHRVKQAAYFFGIDVDNQLKVGGWSMGTVAHRIYHEGNTTRAADGTLKAI